MKLYTASVTVDYVIVAEDLDEAFRKAQDYFPRAMSDVDGTMFVPDVSEGVHADGWDDDCVPYGGDGNTRTGEYKKMIGEAP